MSEIGVSYSYAYDSRPSTLDPDEFNDSQQILRLTWSGGIYLVRNHGGVVRSGHFVRLCNSRF